jgi:hypothetical protein
MVTPLPMCQDEKPKTQKKRIGIMVDTVVIKEAKPGGRGHLRAAGGGCDCPHGGDA